MNILSKYNGIIRSKDHKVNEDKFSSKSGFVANHLLKEFWFVTFTEYICIQLIRVFMSNKTVHDLSMAGILNFAYKARLAIHVGVLLLLY